MLHVDACLCVCVWRREGGRFEWSKLYPLFTSRPYVESWKTSQIAVIAAASCRSTCGCLLGRQLGPVSQPVSKSVSQLVSQLASQPARSVSQSASQSVSQSVSQPASQPVSQPVSQPASQPVSQSDMVCLCTTDHELRLGFQHTEQNPIRNAVQSCGEINSVVPFNTKRVVARRRGKSTRTATSCAARWVGG